MDMHTYIHTTYTQTRRRIHTHPSISTASTRQAATTRPNQDSASETGVGAWRQQIAIHGHVASLALAAVRDLDAGPRHIMD